MGILREATRHYQPREGTPLKPLTLDERKGVLVTSEEEPSMFNRFTSYMKKDFEEAGQIVSKVVTILPKYTRKVGEMKEKGLDALADIGQIDPALYRNLLLRNETAKIQELKSLGLRTPQFIGRSEERELVQENIIDKLVKKGKSVDDVANAILQQRFNNLVSEISPELLEQYKGNVEKVEEELDKRLDVTTPIDIDELTDYVTHVDVKRSDIIGQMRGFRDVDAIASNALKSMTGGQVDFTIEPETGEERVFGVLGNVGGMLIGLGAASNAIKGTMAYTKFGTKLLATKWVGGAIPITGAMVGLGQLNPELEADWKARVKQVGVDTVFGLALHGVNSIAPTRYVGVALNTAIFGGLAKLNGDTDEEVLTHALVGGVLGAFGVANKRNLKDSYNWQARKNLTKGKVDGKKLKLGENYTNEDVDILVSSRKQQVENRYEKQGLPTKSFEEYQEKAFWENLKFEKDMKSIEESAKYLKDLPQGGRNFTNPKISFARTFRDIKEDINFLIKGKLPKQLTGEVKGITRKKPFVSEKTAGFLREWFEEGLPKAWTKGITDRFAKMEESFKPTEYGKPLVSKDGESIILGDAVFNLGKKGVESYTKNGEKNYHKIKEQLEQLKDKATILREKEIINDKLENLDNLAYKSGWGQDRETDIIKIEPKEAEEILSAKLQFLKAKMERRLAGQEALMRSPKGRELLAKQLAKEEKLGKEKRVQKAIETIIEQITTGKKLKLKPKKVEVKPTILKPEVKLEPKPKKVIEVKKEKITKPKPEEIVEAPKEHPISLQVKATEARKIILESDKAVPHYPGLEKKVGVPTKGFNFSSWEQRRGLMGLISRGEISDTFVLIKDKNIANKILEQQIKIEVSKERRKLEKIKADPKDIEKILNKVEQDMRNDAKETKETPNTKPLYPNKINPEVAKIQGYQKSGKDIIVYLSDGKKQAAINADKMSFIKKQLPEAEFRIGEDSNKPIQITVNGELKGLVMPIKVEGFPFKISEVKFKPKEVKPKIEPEPFVQKAREVIAEGKSVEELIKEDLIRPKETGIGKGRFWKYRDEKGTLIVASNKREAVRKANEALKLKLEEKVKPKVSPIVKIDELNPKDKEMMVDLGYSPTEIILRKQFELAKKMSEDAKKALEEKIPETERDIVGFSPDNEPIYKVNEKAKKALESRESEDRNYTTNKDTEINKKGENVKENDIINWLMESFGLRVKRGFFNQKVFGIYKKLEQVIRIKKGKVSTIAHELGHHLQNILPDSFGVNKLSAYKKELVSIATKPKDIEEGFAEFIRMYITDPKTLLEKTPKFYREFEAQMQREMPHVQEVLLHARKDFDTFKNMPALAKIKSTIEFAPEKFKWTVENVRGMLRRGFDEMVRRFSDDLNPLEQLSMLYEIETGTKLEISKNPYVLGRLLRGHAGIAELFIEKGTIGKDFYTYDKNGRAILKIKGKGLREVFSPIKPGDHENLSTYLKARIDLFRITKGGIKKEVMGYTKDAWPEGVVTGIKKAIKEIETQNPEFIRVAKDLETYQNQLLEYAVEKGFLSKDLMNLFKEMIENYVPLHRIHEIEVIRSFRNLGISKVNVPSPFKRFKGSDLQTVDPIQSIIKNTFTIINAVERNAVGQALAELAVKHPIIASVFEKIPTPTKKVARVGFKEMGLKKILEDAGIEITGEMESHFIDIFRPNLIIPKDRIVNVQIEGKPVSFQADKIMHETMINGLNDFELGLLGKLLLAPPARVLRAGAVLSPEFIFRNPLRDQGTAYIYSKYGFIPGMDSIKGFYEAFSKGEDYWLWKASGGAHAALVSMDRNYMAEAARNLFKVDMKNKFIPSEKNPLTWLRKISELMEEMTRLGEFRKGLDKKANPLEAALASREITIDFSRAGTNARQWNKITAFFNANLQGNIKLFRELRPGQRIGTNLARKIMAKTMLGITLPSIMLWMRNKDIQDWRERPQWERDTHWYIYTSKDADPIIIPKPFELGVIFGSLPENILQGLYENDPNFLNKALFNVKESTALSSITSSVIPTGVQPILENVTNYQFFFNRPVVSKGLEGLEEKEQFNLYTSELAKFVAKANIPGFKSPQKIDNLISSYFASLGKYATVLMTDPILKATGVAESAELPAKTWKEMPLVKAFFKEKAIGSRSKSVDNFFEETDKIEKFYNTFQRQLKQGRKETAIKTLEENPFLLLAVKGEEEDSTGTISLKRTFSDLRNLKESFIRTNMTPEAKRKASDLIDSYTTDSARTFLAIMKSDKYKTVEQKRELMHQLNIQMKDTISSLDQALEFYSQ